MLRYSANNQTFYSSKTQSINWLGLEFLNITFSVQEDDPIVDIEEVIQLLSGDTNDSFANRRSNPPYL